MTIEIYANPLKITCSDKQEIVYDETVTVLTLEGEAHTLHGTFHRGWRALDIV